MAPSRTSNPSDVQKIINEMKKNPPQTLPAHDSSELVREIDKMLMETKASDMRHALFCNRHGTAILSFRIIWKAGAFHDIFNTDANIK